MASSTGSWRPKGHPSTLSIYMVANGAQKVIDFMTDVFHAQPMCKMMSDDNSTVKHASLRIHDSVAMISDGCPQWPAFPVWMHVYVEDVDKTYALALSKGAESVQAPKDEFYGDRACAVKDVAGNTWWIATHKFDPQANCSDNNSSNNAKAHDGACNGAGAN